MNKEFIKKMMQAKKLGYEALKEIMPEEMKNRVDSIEKEVFDLLKDIAVEMIKDDADDKADKTGRSDKADKRTKKVNVEFN